MRRALAARPWATVAVIYVASRAFSTLLLGTLFALARLNHWAFDSPRAHPTFFTFSGSWDSSFYKRIAETGYPTTVPVDAAGHVVPNPWAFLPVFPGIVHGVTAVTGLSFYPAGVLVATVFGFGAALMLHRLLLLRVPQKQAAFAVLLFCIGPAGFLLQVAYAESAFLFFLFAALWCLMSRRYWLLIPFTALGAFTRPGILALALVLGVHFAVRLWGVRTRGAAFPLRDAVAIVVGALCTAAAGLAWPVIATAVTGRSSAYLDTELSWWVGFVGRRHFEPLTPWFVMAGTFLGWIGVVLVVLVLAAGGWWLTRRSTRSLGHEILGFTASYWLYLIAVFLPQQSLIRLMMPVAPLLGSPVFAATRRRRVVLVVAALVLQGIAVVLLWFVGYP